MNELVAYFLPHKAISLIILIFIVIAWYKKYKARTCLSLLPNLVIILFGAIIIWFYPAYAFACELCEFVYWVPYFILPLIVFAIGLGITKVIKSF